MAVTKKRVENYLSRLGVGSVSIDVADTGRQVPLHLQTVGSVLPVEMQGERYLLVFPRLRYEEPGDLIALGEEFESAYGLKAVFCIDSNNRDYCRYLQKHGVDYVVPGRQVFLPPRMVFESDRAYSEIDSSFLGKRISPNAQLLLIWYLANKGLPPRVPFVQVMDALQMPNAYLSKAAKELELRQLATVAYEGRQGFVEFDENRRTLWRMAEPGMTNPCRKTARGKEVPQGALLAGMSALAQMGELSYDGPVVCACSAKTICRRQLGPAYEGVVIQCWRYDPGLVGFNCKCVDPFSLYLTMRDESDPRLIKEARNLVEGAL